jgi:hypothetical protein
MSSTHDKINLKRLICHIRQCKKRKRSCTYLKVKINNNHLCQQQSWCNLSQFSNTLILINTVVILIVWDNNEYIIIVYEAVSSMITSLCSCCNIYWNVLTYNDISERVSYHIFNSQYNHQKSTCFDFKSELCWCITADEFLSNSVWYSFIQTECCHQTEQEWSLFEKSECTKQAAVDQSQEQNWHQCSHR